VIDTPYTVDDTSGGTIQKYYNNYTTLVRVYAGIDSSHPYASSKPYELIGTIQQSPDRTANETKVNIQDYVQRKLNSDNDVDQASYPNDLNLWCDFYIEFAESYDSVNSDGFLETTTSPYTSDSANFCHAVNGVLQFGDDRGGNMYDHVVSPSRSGTGNFMTFFEKPVLFVSNWFDISVVLDDFAGYPILEITEKDQNGNQVATQTREIKEEDQIIEKQGSSLEFDTSSGLLSESLIIDSAHVVNFWQRDASGGYCQMFRLDPSTPAITALGAAINFEASGINKSQPVLLQSGFIVLFYKELGGDLKLQLFSYTTSTGNIAKVGSGTTITTGNNSGVGAVKINDTRVV